MIKELLLINALAFSPIQKAENVVEEPTTEVQEPTTTEEDDALTQEEFTDKVKEWMEQYLSADMVANIINWAINSGLLVTLFGIYLKYRKYKSLSSKEIADKVEERIKEELSKSFKNMSTEELSALANKIDNFEQVIATLQKALVLSQDKTSEGKKALLNLITEKTSDEDVKKTATEVKEKVEEEQKAVDEVQDKVKSDYIPID